MPNFIAISSQGGRTEYLNLALVRAVFDNPSEEGVRVEFDEKHRVYLDRAQAKPLLDAISGDS